MLDWLTDTLTDPAAIWLACCLCGIGVPVPEEVLGAWAGLQAEAFGGLVGAWAAAGSGFLIRDVICWGIGHRFGDPLVARAEARGWLPAERTEAARALIRDKGGKAVLVGRMMVGMRAITWLVAGASGIPLRTFVMYDVLGLMATTGVFVGVGAAVGPVILDVLGGWWTGPLVGGTIGALAGTVWWRDRRRRRRAAASD